MEPNLNLPVKIPLYMQKFALYALETSRSTSKEYTAHPTFQAQRLLFVFVDESTYRCTKLDKCSANTCLDPELHVRKPFMVTCRLLGAVSSETVTLEASEVLLNQYKLEHEKKVSHNGGIAMPKAVDSSSLRGFTEHSAPQNQQSQGVRRSLHQVNTDFCTGFVYGLGIAFSALIVIQSLVWCGYWAFKAIKRVGWKSRAVPCLLILVGVAELGLALYVMEQSATALAHKRRGHYIPKKISGLHKSSRAMFWAFDSKASYG
jgi:hypothetical protein